jgi:pyruvate,water dikinase
VAAAVPVREDRALWQLRATGLLRQAVLRRGRRLADDGVLADPADVVYLTPAEYDDPPADAAALVSARRAEHQRWLAVRPPLFIGGDEAPPAMPEGPVLTGVGASSGRVEGTARVIVDLADADRLQPGDVLVCTTTSPPWTPLFALAAAVVADAGDRVSHMAIAARDYGIPCVVGTAWATAAIPDGARVAVDGDAGTVERV